MAGILDDAFAVAALIRPTRVIGFLIPHVVVEEVARDTLFITQHPVEKGASISDHAFSLPVEVEMTVGWSDSSVGFFGYAAIVYQEMLALQQTRDPFTVYTPGRVYPNMLIRSIERNQDEQTGRILMARITLQQAIIVSTQVTSTGHPKAAQASPQKTTTPLSGGTKQLRPTGIGSDYASSGA